MKNPVSWTTRRQLCVIVAILVSCTAGAATPPPVPFGAVPSPRQLIWQERETYAFVHFTINTYTGREWGYGDESPALFAPSDFDADLLVQTLQAAGLNGLILTAKHHDGFCLWPSQYTEHDIARSPFRDGQGDLVREVADACRRAGLPFGIYLSPWDRHHAEYGRPAYVEYYRNQLQELLTGYGPLFEIWFDGANGGDGYYGGARETRKIDRLTYYDWPTTWALVRALQPAAAIFSDAGPDARWVGNEKGYAGDPHWATIDAREFHPGKAEPAKLQSGDRFGPQWLPAEVDVSIRPGWFFHPEEDTAVKTPAELFSIYLHSVGRGANLLLNVPPDRRGRIAAPDSTALSGWKKLLDRTFAQDLAAGAKVTATGYRGGDDRYAPARLVDGQRSTYWATDDEVRAAEVVLEFAEPRTFDLVRVREFLPLGHRVDRLAVDREDNGHWVEIAAAESIGAQRLLPTEVTTTQRIRLRVSGAACPALSEVGLFLRPPEVAGQLALPGGPQP